MYYHIKLWIWWNYIIEQDEFSNKLEFYYIKYMYGEMNELQDISLLVIRQRQIAHMLDKHDDVFKISPEHIKLAKIKLF